MKNPFDRRRREFDEEIEAHLRMAAADRRERGESAEAARAGAVRELGNPTLLKDITRSTWGWLWLERLTQDLRYALRQLRKSPAFTLAAMGTLALGLGATAAMFTVVDRVLLRPLPYRNARELVNIHETGSKGPVEFVPFLDLQQWRQSNHTLQEVAFHDENAGIGHLDFLEGSSGVTQVLAPRISGNLTKTLGVQPAKGRGFRESKETGAVNPDDAHTILLSDAVWRTVYGADEAILGKVVRLSGEGYTVIGVMPRGFSFPYNAGNPLVWRPIVLGDTDKVWTRNVSPTYYVIARRKAGVRQSAIEADLKLIQAGVAKTYADPYERDQLKSVEVVRYGDSLVNSDLQKSLWALFGASGVLWLIACVNVTSLLLARATARQREIAVRGALGASRTRIIQQLLVEGLVLSLGASLLGAGLSTLTLAGFNYALTEQLHIDVPMTPNLPIMSALLGFTVVSALLACLWPAHVAANAAIEPALRKGAGGARQYRTRFSLVVIEIAMSLTLLVGCGLLLRTLYALHHVPLGFRTDHIVVANLSIPAYKYAARIFASHFTSHCWSVPNTCLTWKAPRS